MLIWFKTSQFGDLNKDTWAICDHANDNVASFVYGINIDGIGTSWVSLDAEFGGEYGWIFVLKYPL